ncbi:MAG: excinuclease ABC subunit C [Myxococcota bacterium]|jgi:excinuclease ABC subunit C
MTTLAEKADRLPRTPGVYLFRNAKGKVLYVGKARDLYARVRQYIHGHDDRQMVRFLVQSATDVDAVLVNTEKEALILESTLIKEHQPRYNVRLLDGASFLHLHIDTNAKWPRYRLVRKIGRDARRKGVRYIGPIPSAGRARTTLDFLERRFPLRTCTDRELKSRKRPCLLHQMKRCIAPCVDLCTKEEYAEALDESLMFLDGRSKVLLDRLAERMMAHAEAERFEQAALIRDQIKAIKKVIERQQMVDEKLSDRDIWGIYREAERGVAVRIPVRNGAMREPIPLRIEGAMDDDDALLSTLLNAFYEHGELIPGEILLPVAPPDIEGLAELLSERRGKKVLLKVPQRGAKTRLIDLAYTNAKSVMDRARSDTEKQRQTLTALQRICHLPRLPRRIECFDNSNIQGSDPVGSMVVFVDGKPAKKLYRKFHIKTVEGADDFASMAEVLGRRMRRAMVAEPGDWQKPDLMVVDGGKGQLSAAMAILKELGVTDVPLIGLSKPRTERKRGDRETPDKIVLPGVKNPIILRNNHPALHLLQALRDESHRTAVRFHRQKRRKRTFDSALLDLPGVGPSRRTALLKHFGAVAAITSASVAQLAAVDGIGLKMAEGIWAALHEE